MEHAHCYAAIAKIPGDHDLKQYLARLETKFGKDSFQLKRYQDAWSALVEGRAKIPGIDSDMPPSREAQREKQRLEETFKNDLISHYDNLLTEEMRSRLPTPLPTDTVGWLFLDGKVLVRDNPSQYWRSIEFSADEIAAALKNEILKSSTPEPSSTTTTIITEVLGEFVKCQPHIGKSLQLRIEGLYGKDLRSIPENIARSFGVRVMTDPRSVYQLRLGNFKKEIRELLDLMHPPSNPDAILNAVIDLFRWLTRSLAYHYVALLMVTVHERLGSIQNRGHSGFLHLGCWPNFLYSYEPQDQDIPEFVGHLEPVKCGDQMKYLKDWPARLLTTASNQKTFEESTRNMVVQSQQQPTGLPSQQAQSMMPSMPSPPSVQHNQFQVLANLSQALSSQQNAAETLPETYLDHSSVEAVYSRDHFDPMDTDFGLGPWDPNVEDPWCTGNNFPQQSPSSSQISDANMPTLVSDSTAAMMDLDTDTDLPFPFEEPRDAAETSKPIDHDNDNESLSIHPSAFGMDYNPLLPFA